jgi:hypothetical protein
LVISAAFIWSQAWQYEKNQLTDWENINATYFPTGYFLDQVKLLDFSLFKDTPAVKNYLALQAYRPLQFHNISSAMTKAVRWLGVGLIVEIVSLLLIARCARKHFGGNK